MNLLANVNKPQLCHTYIATQDYIVLMLYNDCFYQPYPTIYIIHMSSVYIYCDCVCIIILCIYSLHFVCLDGFGDGHMLQFPH